MILTYSELEKVRNNYPDKKIALVKGSFDLFHYGHLEYLRKVREYANILVVEVKSDEEIKKKGYNRPVIGEKERVAIVDSIKYVDFVILANEERNSPLLQEIINLYDCSNTEIQKFLKDGYIVEMIKPNYIFHSSNQVPRRNCYTPILLLDLCKRLNIEIREMTSQYPIHTSDIIKKCNNIK